MSSRLVSLKRRSVAVVAAGALASVMLAGPVVADPNDHSCEGQWAAFDAQYLAKVLDSSLGQIISASPNTGQDFRAVMHNLCVQLGPPPKFKDL